MDSNEVVKDTAVEVDAEIANESVNPNKEIPQPILPDAEYAAEAEKDDPEELDNARRRLMILLRTKCRSVGDSVLTFQIQPMVYSMTLKDCNNMYDLIKKKGIVGLMSVANKHNKMVKKQGN